MRVCLVYDCLFPHTVGGAERWYRNLGERLAADGHEVTYLTLRQWERGADPGVAGVDVKIVGPRMPLYVSDASGRRRILPPLVFGLGVLWHLLRHGRRYDAVHTASFPYFSLLAAAAARPLGRYAIVVDWHEVWSRAYWRAYLGRAGGAVGAFVQRCCARVPQRAFCFSRLHAARLRDEGLRGEPVVLTGEYVGSPQAPQPAQARPVVVFAGRHIPEKRVPALLPAFALAREAAPELRMEVYGDGPERPRLLAEIEGLSVETEGREGIVARGMGAFAAVAQGSEQEPALIVLRYDGTDGTSGPRSPLLGFVGKAVTFDSGGISLKPGPKMSEMKFDMSGGAAVLEAIGAIARLRLPVKLVGVVGATENLPSGGAVKPGDIVTAASGKTIEVNNTDAEGRLVLADCLHHAVSLGAQQIVDLATLTGAVIVALGSTHAGLISNDDELAERVAAAGARSGEIVWRLPLHEEYDKLIEGRYGDLNNAPEERKAGTIVGATFLSHFVGDTPWAHLDIAGSAWDLGRAYAPKSASGYGVRLLVELARSYAR